MRSQPTAFDVDARQHSDKTRAIRQAQRGGNVVDVPFGAVAAICAEERDSGVRGAFSYRCSSASPQRDRQQRQITGVVTVMLAQAMREVSRGYCERENPVHNRLLFFLPSATVPVLLHMRSRRCLSVRDAKIVHGRSNELRRITACRLGAFCSVDAFY